MIEIRNLHKAFGDKIVLNNLTVVIPDSKIFGLVGINGAGKSTLLRIISGVFKSDNGSVLIDGEEVYELHKRPYGTVAVTLLGKVLTIAEELVPEILILKKDEKE